MQRAAWRFGPGVWLIGVAIVIAVGYLIVARFLLAKRVADAGRSQAGAVESVTAAPSTIPEKSIAVLPFVDLSEKKDQEYFSDGLSDELIDLLAKCPI